MECISCFFYFYTAVFNFICNIPELSFLAPIVLIFSIHRTVSGSGPAGHWCFSSPLSLWQWRLPNITEKWKNVKDTESKYTEVYSNHSMYVWKQKADIENEEGMQSPLTSNTQFLRSVHNRWYSRTCLKDHLV